MGVRLIAGLAACAALLGCFGKAGQRRAIPEDYGEVLVYVQSFPQEADRLRFRLAEAWAEREDGTRVPLALALQQFDPDAIRRQRLLVFDGVPLGSYRGLLLRAEKATLRTEDGTADLLVPEAPARVALPFVAARDRPAALFLRFRYGESVQGGIQFQPAFTGFVPDRPTTPLLGFVACPETRHLAVFDKKAKEVVGAIPTGDGPRSIALDGFGRRAYVCATGSAGIDVIDVASWARLEQIPLNLGDGPLELYLAQDRRTLVVLNGGSNTVSLVDGVAGSEVGRVAVGQRPVSMVLDRTGRRAAVFNNLGNTISVIDLPNRSVAATFATEPGPALGELNRQGDRLYVAHSLSPYLLAVDFASLRVVKRVLVGGGVSALKTDVRTDMLYLSRVGEAVLTMYDPFSLLPAQFIPAGGSASRMAVDAEENNLYLAQPEQRSVSVVNLNQRKVIAEMDLGRAPSWVSVMGER